MKNSEKFLPSALRQKLTPEQITIIDGMQFGSRLTLKEKVNDAALQMYQGNQERNPQTFSFKKWLMSFLGKLIENWLITGVTALFILMLVAVGILNKNNNSTYVGAVLLNPSLSANEDINVKAAMSVLSDFYRYWNLHRFEDARNLLTAQYARKEENFSLKKMQEFALKINGGITISNLKLLENESKENVKVFDYTTRYVLKSDGGGHGEQLRAYVVFRNETWTIDTIQIQSFY